MATVMDSLAAGGDPRAAPDVVVFCEPTLRRALADAGALFRARSRAPVRLCPAPGALLVEQVARGARSDLLVIAASPPMDAAAARGLLRPDTRYDAWRNRLVLARRADVPAPADLTTALTGGGRIAAPDAPYAVSVRDALRAAGIDWSARVLGTAGTADAAFLLRTRQVEFAVLYATDVAADPTLAVAAPLAAAGEDARYAVAATHNMVSVNTVAFAAFLRDPAAAAALHAAGLEAG